jgi:hypothetical protein
MAKLKPIEFHVKNKTDEVLKFRSEVSVNQDGIFALTVPEDLAASAQALRQSDRRWNLVEIHHAQINWRVQSADLALAQQFIKQAMANHLAVETEHELIIAYRQQNTVAYYEGHDGQIYGNGYEAGSTGGHAVGQWHGALNATAQAAHYSVGLAARVLLKTTYRRPAGVKVVYDRPRDEDEAAHPELKRLNAFVGLNFGRPGSEGKSFEEMPYSAAAVHFFTEAMTSMCAMARRMEQFFGQPAALEAAIAQQGLLLEGPSGSTPRLLSVAASAPETTAEVTVTPAAVRRGPSPR